MVIEEEVQIGTQIGILEAIDQDIGENAKIGYLITCKFDILKIGIFLVFFMFQDFKLDATIVQSI